MQQNELGLIAPADFAVALIEVLSTKDLIVRKQVIEVIDLLLTANPAQE